MRVKVKFKCEVCGKTYYNHVTVKNFKDAKRYKNLLKDDNSLIHWLEDKCKRG